MMGGAYGGESPLFGKDQGHQVNGGETLYGISEPVQQALWCRITFYGQYLLPSRTGHQGW